MSVVGEFCQNGFYTIRAGNNVEADAATVDLHTLGVLGFKDPPHIPFSPTPTTVTSARSSPHLLVVCRTFFSFAEPDQQRATPNLGIHRRCYQGENRLSVANLDAHEK
jgi:hypothetical protein